MRIAQLIDSLTVGGAEKLLVIFAREARKLEVDLTLVGMERPRFPEILQELETLDVRVITLEGRGLFDPRKAVHLVRFLRHERFDVVFTHLTMANALGPIAASLVGTPSISTLHNQTATPRQPHRALELWALRRWSRRVVAVGDAVAEAHRERLGGKSPIVIPNPVAPIPALSESARRSLRDELVGNDKRFIIMSTGMLTPQKAFSDLLSAFAELRRSHREAALVIAGDGPLAGRLADEIDEAGLRGHAHLLGVRDDVPRLLAAVDAYVCSSHWEGLPLSVLEAMAAGLPVVATAVGDLPTALIEGTGLLVEARKPKALAESLRSLLEDQVSAQTMGAAARQHVARHYSPEPWAARLLSLAAEVAEAGAPAPGHSGRSR